MNTENDNLIEGISALEPTVIRCFYTKKSTMPDSYSKRITHCYELEYVPWGEGYVMTDGQRLDASPGSVFFRRPGMEIHGFLPYSSCGILLENVPDMGLPIYSVFSPSHPIGSLFQEVYKYYLSNDPLDQLRMKADVLNIFYHLLNNSKHQQRMKLSSSAQYHMVRLEHLTAYIDRNLDKPLTLAQLAEVCSVSPGFLCRLFKQTNNQSVFTYINECRIQRAKQLLIETDRPIKDICTACGFETESYFYRTFKRLIHISPAGYRKVHRLPYLDIDECLDDE